MLPSHKLKQQSGVVIVVALFIVALVAAMAYFMMSRLERDIRRTSLLTRNVQAELYAQGSIAWARDQLRSNWEKQKKDQPTDRTPIQSSVNEVNGYSVQSTIYDMNARFNLNNAATPEGLEKFQLLLKNVLPKLSAAQVKQIADSLHDWIAPNSPMQDQLNKYYLARPVPYRAPHRLMLSISELTMVKGMTPEIYNVLKPYVAALPNTNALINLQAAPLPVLMALHQNVTLEAAQAVIENRAKAPITMEIFNNIIQNQFHIDMSDGKEIATTKGDYFLVETSVSIDTQHVLLYTLLERAEKDTKSEVNVMWQSKGTW